MPKKEATEAPANERVEQAVEEIMRLSENIGNEITLDWRTSIENKIK